MYGEISILYGAVPTVPNPILDWERGILNKDAGVPTVPSVPNKNINSSNGKYQVCFVRGLTKLILGFRSRPAYCGSDALAAYVLFWRELLRDFTV